VVRKVFFILLALVFALSLSLIGCGGGGEEEEEEEEPIQYEYIILGAPLPLLYNDGLSTFNNLKLAIDEINDAGGFDVGGTMYKFQLEALDDNDLNPTVPTTDVLAVVENLITSKHADFIIGGTLRSEAALAQMDTIADYETVAIWSAGFLSPGMASKFAGDPAKYKYSFRTQGSAGPITSESLTLMNSIAADKGLAKTAYIVTQDVAHAKGAGDGLKASLEADGWTVAGLENIPSGTTEFTTTLDNAEASGAKFLWLDFDMPESVYLVKGWYDRQLDMLPIGFVVPAHDSKAWSVFGGKCEYLVNCYVKAGITPINSQAAHYISLYESQFGVEPGLTWVAPVSYQVVYILKDALERAGSLDADNVIAALEATDMTGVYGHIEFDANHDMVYSDNPTTGAITTWVQWIDGERVTVYPEVVKTADVVLPDWMS
jgi:branched-chain amino acid transport system substrate-binding protein